MNTKDNPEKRQPFGNPDGSRADIKDITDGFVIFSDENVWGGIATKKNDFSARIIVGRKGSGKTVYLRRLHSFAQTDESIYTEKFQQALPTTETILKFCNWFKENVLTEKWMELWSRAILRSVMSHILYSPQLISYTDDKRKDLLKKEFKSILPDTITPLNIYSQVSEIINSHHSQNDISLFLSNPKWNQLEWFIGDIISTTKPLYFYIDAVDEEYYHAPMYWLRAQKGLFYQTMRYLRDSNLGNRLHIFICIREHVLASVYKSEHQTRYIEEPHIRLLRWNKDSALYLLQEKVKKLDKEYYFNDGDSTIENWVGLKEIYNEHRELNEPIVQYLLRHTRLLPRDIIILGNKLCQSILKAKFFSTEKPIDKVIKQCVSESAKIFGNEQLAICANHISSNMMPENAAIHNYSDFYTGNKEHESMVKDDLIKVICLIGKDRFSIDDLLIGKEYSKEIFRCDVDVFSILWMNGLLGYVKENSHSNEVEFFSEDYLEDFNLPLTKKQYVFHSILIDSVEIKPIGKPIISFRN
jgi:ABC-type dipeptide/oligopeptide/nickel transport system ATPase component